MSQEVESRDYHSETENEVNHSREEEEQGEQVQKQGQEDETLNSNNDGVDNDDENSNDNSNSNNDDDDDDDDDLFGEGSDNDDEEVSRPKSNTGGLSNFIEEDDGEVDEDEGDEDADGDDDMKEKQIHAIDLDLAKHPASYKTEDDESYFVNLPAFLNIEALPFDAPAFKESIIEKEHLSTEDKKMEKLFAENVIRWRYNKVGDKVYKQSNAHFVEWSDGSLSLKLGNELFDVVRNPTSDHFLTVRHNELEIFQTDTIFSRNMKFIPSSTGSEIHKRLTNYIKAKNTKTGTVSSALLDVDPEEQLRQREKEEDEAIRHKRRLEQKRLLEEEKMEKSTRVPRSSSSYAYNYDEDDEDVEGVETVAGKLRASGYFDEDDDDDFVAEDDEEIDNDDEEDDLEKSERLNRLKEGGMNKYQQQDDAGEEDDDEETTVRSHKKRRVIADDEDDY